MAVIALFGVGELGSVLRNALSRGHEVRPWSRSSGTSLTAALEGAQTVLSAVPGSASRDVFEAALPLLAADTPFIDLTSAAPQIKEESAQRHRMYADAAVLGTVIASGAEVPIVAAGPAAPAFAELGLNVTVLEGASPGDAARLKLIRSVYMKGRDALVLETMLAARRAGIEDEVARSIAGPGEQVPFTELSERVLRALALHAGRRADELASSAAILRELGVDPLMAEAGAERLRSIAHLREHFGGERPASGGETLEAAERDS
jgi:3-hydroxyisobutyrate dehydrogenase-like beta-hydroxyacid dehydrogenase